jgi:hypothetical protein
MNENYEFNKILVEKIKTTIRLGLSPRHVPNIILKISEIPVFLKFSLKLTV